MKDALVILDELHAPGEIGAHLDHAIAELGRKLGIEVVNADVGPDARRPANGRPCSRCEEINPL